MYSRGYLFCIIQESMKIIAIGSHLDDIEIGAGGTLSKLVQEGNEVKMLVMSESAFADFDGNMVRTREEAMREGHNAAEILGAGSIEILDFPNKDIPYNSTIVEVIDSCLTHFQPDLIFTHSPYDTHQDHHNTALASISAARYFNNVLFYEPFHPAGKSYMPYRPQIYFDISDTLEKKIAMLEAHESQLKRYGENWIKAIIGRAKLRGFECGVEHAETFECLRLKLSQFKIK